MSLVSKVSEGLAKQAIKGKALPKKSITHVKAMPGRAKTQGKAFGHAVKHTPGESLGTHIQEHRVGTAFTAVGVGADGADIVHDKRRSTHTGIDTK